MLRFDYGVIGGGPAGYTSAINAAKLGKKVVLFEENLLGGACLNRGCIPTKTILHSAQLYEDILSSSNLGINTSGVSLDFSKVMSHKDDVVAVIRKNLELVIRNSGVVTINSRAEILTSNKIKANGEIYECGEIICAVGAEPYNPTGFDFDGKYVINSDDILNLAVLPARVLIVGSGAIGTEWARILSSFGVEVIISEVAERLLPSADTEVSKRLERIYKKRKIKYYTGVTIKDLEKPFTEQEQCRVLLSNDDMIYVDFVLVAAGRKPKEHSKVDGVKYIGDVAGEIQLAHYAIKQANKEILQIPYRKQLIPSVIYGNPEIAWVGARECDLVEGTYQKSTILISALGKSHCDNCTDGFIKILSRDGYIVGAHIISKEASALIQEVIIAMQNNVTIDKLKEVCFAHPTYSEGIYECITRL